MRHLRRRDFLKLAGSTAAVLAIQACSTPARPSSTQAPAAQPTPVKPAAQAPAVPTQSPPAPTQAPTIAPAATIAATGPKKGGTFNFAATSTIQEFNPYNMRPGHYSWVRAIFNTLAHYDSQLKPQPELAEKWALSADGLSMTLNLRQGVKFHSGKEFTSADVKSSWEFATTDTNSTQRTLYNTIKQVEMPDKYTAVLKFERVNPGLYDLLDTLSMIDKDSIAGRANSANGTGPFKLDKYVPNDRAELVAFKDYWDAGKPYLDKYVVRIIPDISALAINLESGAVDAIWQPSFLDLVRLKDAGGKFAIDMGAPGAQFFNLAVNVKAEPFTNKKVRQAMAWSIDRARFCQTILKGLVQPTCLIWPSNSWAYFPDLQGKIGFDLAKAGGLLKEAGLEKGFTTEILTSSTRSFGQGDIAQILQADLKKINVDAKVVDVDPTQYDARMNKGDIVMSIHTYGSTNKDPGTTVTGAKAWYNEKEGGWTHLDSAAWDSLRAELQSTLDQEKRKATCRKLQEMALDECFTDPIAPNQRPWAYASYVKGLAYTMDNATFVDGIWLNK